MRILTAVLLLAAASGAVADDVYKWVDKDGVTHYGDKPPNRNAKPAELPPLQTYPGDKLPADLGTATAPPPAPAPAKLAVQIMSPSPDETIRNGEPVAVAVVVSPGLAPGQRLVYLDNGQPVGTPTGATSQPLMLERGSHALEVAVVDAGGKEVARSPVVTVHMKPPTVKKSAADAQGNDQDGRTLVPAGFARPQPPRFPRPAAPPQPET